MTETAAAPAADPREQMVRVFEYFANLQAQRKKLKADYDAAEAELKQKEDQLRAALLRKMDADGTNRIDAGNFKAHIRIDKKAQCGDWDALGRHILETGRIDLLQRRLVNSAVLAELEENGAPPPGVTMVTERLVVIGKK